MADKPKKPGLAMAVAVDAKKGTVAAPKEDDSYGTAVDELFDAVKAGDKEAFRDAFEAAVMSCK
jgi:hypothetical protein